MSAKRNLSPAFLHVNDRPQVDVAAWVQLGTLAQVTRPAFVRHVQAKNGGYSLTVYDSEADVFYRSHCPAGVMSALRAIERKNDNVHILGQGQFVRPDRFSVGFAMVHSGVADWFHGLIDVEDIEPFGWRES